MNSAALSIRIIADDLTGALDAAAPMAARLGVFAVGWGVCNTPAAARAAFDAETRDLDPSTASQLAAAAAERWWRGFEGLAFKKVDSVWRGHAAAEIAATMSAGGFEHAIVAPAFPAQGRLTRDGAQWIVDGNGQRCVAPDLVADLRAAGLPAARDGAADDAARVWICDAADQGALEVIVARYARFGTRLLWCGSAGLAHALARTLDGGGGAAEPQAGVPDPATGPVLVLVGTDHPAAQAQAAALAGIPGVFELWIDLDCPDGDHAPAVPKGAPVVLVRFVVPPGDSRAGVAARTRRALMREAARLPRPRLAVATGGETLRALGDALGATEIAVVGERCAGVPCGTWANGRWAGIPLFSKSGGFGSADLLASLATPAARPTAEAHATVRNN